VDLSVQLAPKHKVGLLLTNPVMTASGTFGYGTEYDHIFDIQKLGAIVCKGTTLEPKEGNPQPRLVETASGVLNAIGLQNIGVKALVREKAPIWAKWKVPVIVNIAGATVDEYVRVAQSLKGVSGISALEINISCPNVAEGGAEFGAEPDSAAKVTAMVKTVTDLPVIVKLTPNNCDVVEIACAVVDAGADALTLINTLKGMAIDVYRYKPALGNITGGLSGPAIKPIALRIVYEIASKIDIPIIGSGGISSGNDALEFLMAGASAIQVGVASFANPRAPLDILESIERFLEARNIKSLSEIIGKARQ
jgi:dihydroorotate dehydrogenase (NAD+) catalytic subunit